MLRVHYLLYALLAMVLGLAGTSGANEPQAPFRFHALSEPASLDPAALSEATGGFMMFNLYRGLYRLDESGKLLPELAQSCEESPLKITCHLNPNCKWSDGTPITAPDFVFAFRRLVKPGTRSMHKHLLFAIRNARAVELGKLSPEELGVRAIDNVTLELVLSEPDPEFRYNLASPVLTPLRSEPPVDAQNFPSALTNGPYQISSWQKKSRIQLSPNPHYCTGATARPPVEIVSLDDDTTAKSLYDLGKLSFLRRLLTKEIPTYRGRSEFYFIPTMRFDYVGFGPALKDHPELRKALAHALDFPQLDKLFYTPGQFGCPSLPKTFAEPWPCLKQNLTDAKAAFAKAKARGPLPKLELAFSRASGEDVARGMEWMQAQWKKNLGLRIELRSVEQGVYLQELRHAAPTLFRKGFNLERPTCAAALENFLKDNTENYIRLDDDELTKLVTQLRSESNPSVQRRLCGQGLKRLVDQNWIIPLGEIYFAMLGSPNFTGWKITPLNQLDLSGLSRRDVTSRNSPKRAN